MTISAQLPTFETVPGWKDRRPRASIVGGRPFEVGDVLGGTYRLTHPLQQGDMGEVFLATHERLPMEFAIKGLDPFGFEPEGFARFQREASTLARLRHPNIVQLVDFNWTEAARPYLVMEHQPGNTLAGVLSRQPLLAPEQVFGIVHQVACGLYAAHRVGIAHLDLKPSNVLLVAFEGRGSLVQSAASPSRVPSPAPPPIRLARRVRPISHGRRRAGFLLVSAVMAAVVGFLATPAWGERAGAWRSLRDYASHAATVCRDQGRSLLDAARGGQAP